MASYSYQHRFQQYFQRPLWPDQHSLSRDSLTSPAATSTIKCRSSPVSDSISSRISIPSPFISLTSSANSTKLTSTIGQTSLRSPPLAKVSILPFAINSISSLTSRVCILNSVELCSSSSTYTAQKLSTPRNYDRMEIGFLWLVQERDSN
jgi:hypothetical protein